MVTMLQNQHPSILTMRISMKFVLLLIVFVPFGAFAQNVESYIEEVTNTKKEVLASMVSTPYVKEQQEVFKKYFTGLGSFSEDVRNFPKLARKYDAYVRKTGVNSFCSQVFLENASWEELIRKCTKNRFFLCADEIKSLPAYRKSFRELLANDLKLEFDASPDCAL